MLTRRSFFARLSALMAGWAFWRPKPPMPVQMADTWTYQEDGHTFYAWTFPPASPFPVEPCSPRVDVKKPQ